MPRVAIVIAVSENTPPLKSLAACRNDGEAFATVLKETGRFDEIVVMNNATQTASGSVKSSISSLVDRLKGQSVDEVVFYFSGHGEFVGDEFYHILSDYDSSARNQTTLANSELDGLIRSLHPSLFVKIVDACYSGASYVKSDDDLGDYLKSSKSGFKDVYFLYSSQVDERSWTDGPISAFTKSLLQAIGRGDGSSIRYRDLISAASDYFETSGKQTPQFITQASFTETFCDSTPQMRALVERYLPALPVPQSPPTTPSAVSPSKSMSLVERVKAVEETYCTREEAVKALSGLKEILAAAQPGSDLEELYEIQISESDEEPEDAAPIGEWLEKRTDHEYFASPRYRAMTYKRRVPKRRSALENWNRLVSPSLFSSSDDTELVDAVRNVVSGYHNSAVLPFQSITLRLNPKSQALAPEECIVAIVASRSEVQIFWSMRHFHYSDWDTAVPDVKARQWSNDGAALRDDHAIKSIGSRIVDEFLASTRRRITKRWPEAHVSNTEADITKPPQSSGKKGASGDEK